MVKDEKESGSPIMEQRFVVRSLLHVLGLQVENMNTVRRACVECLDKPEGDRFKICLEQLDEFKYDAIAVQRLAVRLQKEIALWHGMLKAAGEMDEKKKE